MAENNRYNNSRGFSAPRKYRKNITSDTRLTKLWGRNEEGSAASFNLYVSGNQIRLQVYTGLTEDKQKRNPNITFNFKDQQVASFFTILGQLENLIQNHEVGEKKVIPCPIFGFIKTKDMQKAERREIGKIVVGREKNGVYFITAIDNYHGKVVFPLTLDRDVQIYNVNSNEPASEDYVSKCFALHWIKMVRKLFMATLTQEFTDTDSDDNSKDNQKSNNGNSYNNSEQSSYGGSSSSADFATDSYEDLLP